MLVVILVPPHPITHLCIEEDEDEPLRLLLFAGRDSLSVAKPLAVFPKDELSDPCAVSIPKAWSGETAVRERMSRPMLSTSTWSSLTPLGNERVSSMKLSYQGALLGR